MEKTKSVVILAAGDYPTHHRPLQTLDAASHVVCCDSAYLALLAHCPNQASNCTVVGDADSLPDDLRRSLGQHYIHIAEQDDNDLTKALRWAVQQFGIAHIHFTILGATGRREDHTLGNISLLAWYCIQFPGIDLVMLTDYGLFTPVIGQRTFSSFAQQQVSLFSLTPDQPIDTTGLQWPLTHQRLDFWWQATLNSALGNSFSVSGGTLLVFQTYEPKA